MKHFKYFLIGAIVVFFSLLLASQLPLLFGISELIEAPFVIRTIIGLSIILIAYTLVFASYIVGRMLWRFLYQ